MSEKIAPTSLVKINALIDLYFCPHGIKASHGENPRRMESCKSSHDGKTSITFSIRRCTFLNINSINLQYESIKMSVHVFYA